MVRDGGGGVRTDAAAQHPTKHTYLLDGQLLLEIIPLIPTTSRAFHTLPLEAVPLIKPGSFVF
jgi:hypothetical protein